MSNDDAYIARPGSLARRKPSLVKSLAAPLVALGVASGVIAGFALYWLGTPKGQTVMRTSAGHSVSVLFRTDVSDVEIKNEDGSETFAPLTVGFAPVQGSDLLGRKAAVGTMTPTRVASVVLPPSQINANGPTKLNIRYRAFGIKRETTISFDGATEDCRFARNVLASMPTSWVGFRTNAMGRGGDEAFVYFSTLLAYKYAIREIRYGFDDDPLAQRVHFQESNIMRIDASDQIYINAPRSATRIRVQIVYKDGVETPVQTILRSDATIP